MFSPALVCVSVCVSVCLSVTTITKKIVVPNFVGRFLGGKGRPNRVSLRSVEGCGNDGQKTRRLISRAYVLFQSTFHLVL